jgi:transcriptional regulator with XRE-family HTH domain
MIDRLQTGNFLAELRRERGLTQAELAEKLSVSGKTVSRWETGQTLPDYEQMQQLCEMFSVRMEEVLAGKRIAPADAQPDGTDAPKRGAGRPQRAGWIAGACGIVLSCVFLVLLLTDRCKPKDAQTAATAEPTAEATAEPSAPEPTATPRVWRAKHTAADLPAELSERRLSDDELIALRDASPSVLRERISTVADMLAWFNVTEQEILDSFVNNEPGTNLYSYEKPEKHIKDRFFAADNIATPCAWLIQDDYPGLCVLYVNGNNCFNIMCIGVPYSGGWFVFQPAAFTSHGGFHGVLECVTVGELSELYPILDEFNATHREYLMPIHRIDNLEQCVAFYEDETVKHLSESMEAAEVPR